MAKKIKGLSLLSIFLLSSCGYGQNITEDKERILGFQDAITAKMREVRNFEMSIGSAVFGDSEKGDYTVDYVFDRNEKGDQYMSKIEKSQEAKTETIFYFVNDPTYMRVYYLDTHDLVTDSHDVRVYSYQSRREDKVNLNDDYLISRAFGDPAATYDTLSSPRAFFELRTGRDFNRYICGLYSGPGPQVDYYSKGEGNLTIEITLGRDSYLYAKNMYGTYRVTYENYLLKDATLKSTEFVTSKASKADISFEPKDSLPITLPSGWEEIIDKTIKS
jgi:hypothetical protein